MTEHVKLPKLIKSPIKLQKKKLNSHKKKEIQTKLLKSD